MHGFIYAIHNTVSGKSYVGQTLRPKVERRWYEHKRDLNKGKGTNRHLQGAWNTYGPSAFEFVELERVVADNRLDLEDALTAREGSWMTSYRLRGVVLYNAQAAGKSSAYLRIGTPSHLKGTTLSPEHREKVVKSLKGNTRRKGTSTSEEGRANISAGRKGQPSPKKGTTMTLEQRKKLSDAHRGKPLTEEHRAAQRAAAKGRTWTLVEGVRVYSKLQSKEP